MNVETIIDKDHPFCAMADNLHQAAERICLWEYDALPVCDASRRLVGSISARDVCRLACTSGQSLTELRVADAIGNQGPFGRIDDDLEQLMELMLEARVWQLPMVDRAQRLLGTVSYYRLARRLSGSRDLMIIVPDAQSIDDAGEGYRLIPAWTLVDRHRELIGPDGRSRQLSRGEYVLLLAMAERSDRVLDREYLTQAILRRSWDPSDRYVDVVVGQLRRKLGESGGDARAIRTVPNEGYVFTLKVVDKRVASATGHPRSCNADRLPDRGIVELRKECVRPGL